MGGMRGSVRLAYDPLGGDYVITIDGIAGTRWELSGRDLAVLGGRRFSAEVDVAGSLVLRNVADPKRSIGPYRPTSAAPSGSPADPDSAESVSWRDQPPML